MDIIVKIKNARIKVKESTNIVKSKNRQSELILIAV